MLTNMNLMLDFVTELVRRLCDLFMSEPLIYFVGMLIVSLVYDIIYRFIDRGDSV